MIAHSVVPFLVGLKLGPGWQGPVKLSADEREPLQPFEILFDEERELPGDPDATIVFEDQIAFSMPEVVERCAIVCWSAPWVKRVDIGALRSIDLFVLRAPDDLEIQELLTAMLEELPSHWRLPLRPPRRHLP